MNRRATSLNAQVAHAERALCAASARIAPGMARFQASLAAAIERAARRYRRPSRLASWSGRLAQNTMATAALWLSWIVFTVLFGGPA